jgi:hypothetical protein
MAADLYLTCYSPAMDRWLSRLERRFGRYAPSNLTLWIVGLSGFTYILLYAKPEALEWLVLDPSAVARGEVWRLFTFLFIPRIGGGLLGPLLFVFALLFLYMVGSGLESEWGSFRFSVYYFLGALGTIVAALIIGPISNWYVNLSLVLAFATLFPDYEILFMFFLPLKMKWLGLLSVAGVAYLFVVGSLSTKAGIAIALGNYLLFFAGPLRDRLRGRAAAQKRRVARFTAEPARKPRVCAKCGRSEKDDPQLEFRVCDCQEKCRGKLTEYCLEHARAH